MSNVNIRINVSGTQQIQQLSSVLSQYASAVRNVSSGQGRSSATFSVPQNDIAAFNAQVRQLIPTLDQGTKASNSFSNSLLSIAKGYVLFQVVSAGFNLITRSINEAKQAALDYDKQVARSLRSTGDDRGGNNRAFDAGILRAGTALSGRDIKDTGEVLYQLSTFIKEINTRAGAFDDTMKLLTGTEGDARETTRLLIQTFQQFRDTMDPTQTDMQKIHSVAELIATSFKNANAEVGELAQSLKYLGPTAQAAHIPLEQVYAVVTALSGEGQRGRLAGTEITSLVMNILKNYNAKEGGIVHKGEVFEFKLERNMTGANKGGVDLVKTLQNISNILQHMNQEEGEKWALAVAGTTQAYRALGTEGPTAIKNIIDQTRQMTEATHGASNSLEDLYKEMQKPAQTKMLEAWNALLGNMSLMIDDIVRKIPGLSDGLSGMVNFLSAPARMRTLEGQHGTEITQATGDTRLLNNGVFLGALAQSLESATASRRRVGGAGSIGTDMLRQLFMGRGRAQNTDMDRFRVKDARELYIQQHQNVPNPGAEFDSIIGMIPTYPGFAGGRPQVPNYTPGVSADENLYILRSDVEHIAQNEMNRYAGATSPIAGPKPKPDGKSHKHKLPKKEHEKSPEAIARKAAQGIEAQLDELDEIIEMFQETHSLKDTTAYVVSLGSRYTELLAKLANLEEVFSPEKAAVDKRALKNKRDRYNKGRLRPLNKELDEQSFDLASAFHQNIIDDPYTDQFDAQKRDALHSLDLIDVRKANKAHDPVAIERASAMARTRNFDHSVEDAKRAGDYPYRFNLGQGRSFTLTRNQMKAAAQLGAQNVINSSQGAIAYAESAVSNRIPLPGEDAITASMHDNAFMQATVGGQLSKLQARRKMLTDPEAIKNVDSAIDGLNTQLLALAKVAAQLDTDRTLERFSAGLARIDSTLSQSSFNESLSAYRMPGEDPKNFDARQKVMAINSIGRDRSRYRQTQSLFEDQYGGPGLPTATDAQRKQANETLLGIQNSIKSTEKTIRAGDAAVYNELHDNLENTFKSAIYGIYKGTTSPLQAVASIGDTIVQKLLESTFMPMFDPLVSSLTTQILSLDANTYEIARNTAALAGGAVPPPTGSPGAPKAPGGKGGKGGTAGLSELSMGIAAYSVFANGQQTGPLQGAISGAMAGAAFGPVGAAVGGAIGFIGGLFGGGKKKDPKQEEAEHNPAFHNAPSDMNYYAYRYRATGMSPTAAQLGYNLDLRPAPVVNVYIDRVKTAVRTEVGNAAGIQSTATSNVTLDYHRPL